MYNSKTLKNKIAITDNSVECPVKNCKTYVTRQRNIFKSSPEFFCPKHKIYISPSTIEYKSSLENLLWIENSDLQLLQNIKTVKRESRMERDNSEDSLSWNVFRYLEKNNLITDYLTSLAGYKIQNPEIIYWSYSQSENNTWSLLKQAREEFELNPSKGSEPDIIVICKNALFIIEAKLNASNNTKPTNLKVKEKYLSGGQNLWNNIFKLNFEKSCIENKKYELSRFWLLGTWIAQKLNVNFYLINLVRKKNEKHIEEKFKRHIIENESRNFKRNTWEDIYAFLCSKKLSGDNYKIIKEYFETKTIGYNGKGCLKKAFMI